MINHQVVPIYPPLSSAKLEGLGEGAKLNEVQVFIMYLLIISIIMTCKIMSKIILLNTRATLFL